MTISRRHASLSVLALSFAALTLAGCGGSDGGSSPANAFQGEYTGTYVSSLQDNGTIDVAISRSGRVSADVVSLTEATLTGTVDGSVTSAGAFTGTLTYSSSTTQYSATGTLTRTDAGRITGTLNAVVGSRTAVITIDVAPSITM